MPPMLRAMARGVALFLVGSLVLVALLGCGRWFEQREPWRHDADVECLPSGAVREPDPGLPEGPLASGARGNGRAVPPSYGGVPLGPSRNPALAVASGPAAVAPAATLACPMVSALDEWVTNAVQPAAQRWFGE